MIISDIFAPQDRLYPSDNEYEIPTLLLDQQPSNGILLPFSGWGSSPRCKKGIATYHFYVDDYRFGALWKNPAKIIHSGCKEIVEPNYTLHLTLPLAYGIHLIYKKRWIARWLQGFGIKIWADLKVSKKYRDLNLLGIPKGYNAFATRAFSDDMKSLEEEFEIAQLVSGLENPNMIVYGGGKAAQSFCRHHNLIFVEQIMDSRRRIRKEECDG